MSQQLPDHVTIEVFVACNENGDWVVVADETEALCELEAQMGGNQARVVKITIKMRPPQMSEATVTVPDEAGQEVVVS